MSILRFSSLYLHPASLIFLALVRGSFGGVIEVVSILVPVELKRRTDTDKDDSCPIYPFTHTNFHCNRTLPMRTKWL
jgi:hypothetical protein